MYPTQCPRCQRDFIDAENKVSIMMTGICLICRLEEAREEEIARWEAEGGFVMRNNLC